MRCCSIAQPRLARADWGAGRAAIRIVESIKGDPLHNGTPVLTCLYIPPRVLTSCLFISMDLWEVPVFINVRSLLLLIFVFALCSCQISTPAVKSVQPQPVPKKSAVAEPKEEPVEVAEPQPDLQPARQSEPQSEPQPDPKPEPAAVSSTLGELYVLPTPANARVRIMNIVPKFVQGMRLPAGRYSIEVTAPGYQPYLQWISLEAAKMKRLKVRLSPK